MRSLLLLALILAALINVVLALFTLPRPDEIRYGEAIIYAQAARLLHGQALYQSPEIAPYTVAAYTPVYYWVVAFLRVIVGPGFLPGRLVSFISGLVATGLVGQITWRRTRAVWPSVAASLLFLGLGVPIPWFAAYKEDVLAVALALASISVLDGGTTRVRVVIAALLAALAILTKQTLFGSALLGTLWLAAHDRRMAVLFASVSGGLVLGVVVVLEVATRAFVANTVLANLNPFGLDVLCYNLVVLALFQAGPLLVAVPTMWRRLTAPGLARDLLAGAWLVSLIPLLGLAKEGADYNYWELCAAVTAIVAITTTWEQRHCRRGALSSFAIGINLAAAIAVLGTSAFEQPQFIRPGPTVDAALGDLVALARATPGDVLADPLDIPVLADRPVELEPVIYRLLYQGGHWDAMPMVRRVCRHQVSLLVLAYPLETIPGASVEADQRWPEPVLEALRETFVLQEIVTAGGGQRFVYGPDQGSATSCVGGLGQ